MSNKHFGVQEQDLISSIKNYYNSRGLAFPDFNNAMKFLLTELAEVYELDLSRIGGWIRNNPQNKPTYSKELMAEELGDVIMMAIVAGIAEGVDPVQALMDKMARKLEEKKNVATGISKAYIYEGEVPTIWIKDENGN